VGNTDDINIFLEGRLHNHLWRLAQACVNDFHTRITQGCRNHLCASVMTV